jgi:hypothetical protein
VRAPRRAGSLPPAPPEVHRAIQRDFIAALRSRVRRCAHLQITAPTRCAPDAVARVGMITRYCASHGEPLNLGCAPRRGIQKCGGFENIEKPSRTFMEVTLGSSTGHNK